MSLVKYRVMDFAVRQDPHGAYYRVADVDSLIEALETALTTIADAHGALDAYNIARAALAAIKEMP